MLLLLLLLEGESEKRKTESDNRSDNYHTLLHRPLNRRIHTAPCRTAAYLSEPIKNYPKKSPQQNVLAIIHLSKIRFIIANIGGVSLGISNEVAMFRIS